VRDWSGHLVASNLSIRYSRCPGFHDHHSPSPLSAADTRVFSLFAHWSGTSRKVQQVRPFMDTGSRQRTQRVVTANPYRQRSKVARICITIPADVIKPFVPVNCGASGGTAGERVVCHEKGASLVRNARFVWVVLSWPEGAPVSGRNMHMP